jgi:hypothetical protein
MSQLRKIILFGVNTTHPEYHGGTTGIFDCSITTKLNEISE